MTHQPGQDSAPTLAAAVARLEQGDPAGAETLLSAVLAKTPDHPVAIFLLGLSALERADWVRAENLFRRALALAPGQPRVILPLVQALQAQNRSGEAEALLRTALSAPDLDAATRAGLEHQLGLTMRRLRKHDEALALMQAAARRAPAGRDQLVEQANVLRHLGRFEEAEKLYETVLASEPLALDVHLMLSEMRGDARGDFVAAFDAAIAKAPGRVELPVTKGHLHLKAQQPQAARESFAQALRLVPGDPAALMGLGRALEMLNDAEGAHAAHAASLKAAPESDKVLEACAGFLLRHGELKEAQRLAEKAHQAQPESQGALAMLDLCWRARGDGREEWLNDYERDVQIFDLEPPDGYDDMESFNRELASYLAGAHDGARQYLTQTLRGGTQTHDEMFHNGHALADRLLPRINQAIQSYVAGWRADAGHPFSARRAARGFRHAGSWSSRLADCGFHVNHFHHKGWISSCYYVAVPDVTAAAQPQGWIKFGEAAAEFGPGFTARRMIQPKPGRLVLFPSYMWHGTMPFHSAQSRITIAFDAVPG